MKNKLFDIANMPKCGYSSLALGKISKSVLAGCKDYIGVHSPHWTFFVRNISMRSHLNGEAGEGHLRMCRSLVYLSTNPFQLCHPHLVVTGKAPKQTQGAHSS